MKKGLFSIVLCLAFLVSATSVSAQEDSYRKALAQMLDASGTLAVDKASISQLLPLMQHTYSNVPDTFWVEYEKEFSQKVEEKFIDVYVPIYKKYLTENDLKKITSFYKSPVGSKLAESTPTIVAESVAAGRQFGRELVQMIMQKLQEEGYIEE